MERKIITVGLSDTTNASFRKAFGTRKIPIIVCAEIDEAKRLVEREAFCLIVIDASQWSSYEIQDVVRGIRRFSFIPLLFLTDCENVAPILEDGADICLPKNVDYRSLLAHSMALMRRHIVYDQERISDPGADIIRRGELELDPMRYRVKLSGEEITLHRREFRLLYYFMENPGVVLSPEQICERVWETEYDYNRDVSPVIAVLRSKLKDSKDNPTYIETVYGTGYRFLPSE